MKIEFDKEGISIPFPQSDLHVFNEKQERTLRFQLQPRGPVVFGATSHPDGRIAAPPQIALPGVDGLAFWIATIDVE